MIFNALTIIFSTSPTDIEEGIGEECHTSDDESIQNEDDVVNVDEEIDPLDAFMNSMVLPEVEKLNSTLATHTADDNKADLENKDKKEEQINGEHQKKSFNKSLGRIVLGEDSDSDYGDLENGEYLLEEEEDDEFMKRVKKTKAEELSIVDHSKIDYNPFRKNFYIEVKEISRMTPEEVAAYRKELELKLHGKDVPKPIKTWHQTGLTSKILEMIKKPENYKEADGDIAWEEAMNTEFEMIEKKNTWELVNMPADKPVKWVFKTKLNLDYG